MRHRRARAWEASERRRRAYRGRLAALLSIVVAGATLALAAPAYAAGPVRAHGTVPDVGDPLARSVTVSLACQNDSARAEVGPGSSYDLTVIANPGANCFIQLDGDVFDVHTQINRQFVATGTDDLAIDFTYPGTMQVSVVGPDGQPQLSGSMVLTTQDTVSFADGGQGTIYTSGVWNAADGPVRHFDSPVIDNVISFDDGTQVRDLPTTRPAPGQLVIHIPPPGLITVTGTAPSSTATRQSTVSMTCGFVNDSSPVLDGTFTLSVLTYEVPYCYLQVVVDDAPSQSVTRMSRGVAIDNGTGTTAFPPLPEDRVVRVLSADGTPVTDASLEWDGYEPSPNGDTVSQRALVSLTGADLVAPFLIDSDGVNVIVRMSSGEIWQHRYTPGDLAGPGPIVISLPPIVDHVVSGRVEGASMSGSSRTRLNCENGADASGVVNPDGTYSVSVHGFLTTPCRLDVAVDVDAGVLSYTRDVVVGTPDGGVARAWAPLAAPSSVSVTVLPGSARLRQLGVSSFGTMATPDGSTTIVSSRFTVNAPSGPVILPLGTGRTFYTLYDDDGEYGGGELATDTSLEAMSYVAAEDRWELTTSTDGDGVPAFIESWAPNGGDGNGDGTPDADQPEVTSLPAASGGYLTLAAPTGMTFGPVTTTGIAGLPAPPGGATLPAGLVSFRVDGIAPGGTTTVRIYSDSLAGVTGWAKFHDGVWISLPSGSVSVNAAGGYVAITLTDGGPFDDDGVVNGSVLDPGGPVVVGDAVPPSVSCAAAPSAWSGADVSIACTASDAGSGLADPADASFSLTTSVPAGTETATASTGSREVCDAAGNCATAGPVTGIKVDRKGPDITITAPVGGTQVTQGSAPLAAYSCVDAGSGSGTCAGPVAVGQPVPSGSLGQTSFAVAATDAVGNPSTSTVTYTVVAPNTAPSVTADMGVPGLETIGTQTGSLGLTARFADAEGNGPFTASVQWSPSSAYVAATVTGTTVTATGSWPSAGTRTVTVKVCDAAGACGTDSLTVRSHVRDKVTPAARCVVDQGRSASPRYLARFGYASRASIPLWIPVRPGKENTFRRDPAGRGQPTVFLPGTSRTTFEVTFSSGTQTWLLNGEDASASSSTRRC